MHTPTGALTACDTCAAPVRDNAEDWAAHNGYALQHHLELELGGPLELFAPPGMVRFPATPVRETAGAPRFRFTHAADGGYRAWLGGRWMGDVKRCEPGKFPAPFCGDCGGWHVFVLENQRGIIREVNAYGFATRRDAAVAAVAVRRAWRVADRVHLQRNA